MTWSSAGPHWVAIALLALASPGRGQVAPIATLYEAYVGAPTCWGERYDGVRLQSVEGEPSLVLGLVDYGWATPADFQVLGLERGRIAWFSERSDDGLRCDRCLPWIRSMRTLHIPGFEGLAIETYETTHMGNGDFHLYQLAGRRLRLVACAHARSFFVLEGRYWGGVLEPEYADRDGDGRVDVVLSGTLHRPYDADGTEMALLRERRRTILMQCPGGLFETRAELERLPPGPVGRSSR